MDNKEPKFPKLRPINPRCLTPFTLYQPVPTLQAENMTYIEYLMGILTQINQLISVYNNLSNEVEGLMNLPGRMDEIEQAFNSLETQVTQKLIELGNAITIGDKATLAAANKYTDEQIANLPDEGGSGTAVRYGGLTAAEYDGLDLAAVDYDDLGMTAYEYDNYGKWILLGEDGSLFLQFKNSITFGAGDTVFEIPAKLPLKPAYRYQFEISLGTFSLDGEENAHLEIVGNNTLGNTLPISVPSGGSATVAGVFSGVPTMVRGMSDQAQITAYNAYIKIRPLGEL